MKRLISYLFLYVVLFCSCTEYETNNPKLVVIKATEIKLDANLITLHVGDPVVKLNTEILPKETKDTLVSWASTDNKIAEVVDGSIQALRLGKCLIVASINDKVKSTCEVQVVPTPILATNISTEHDSYEVGLNKEFDIKTTICPNQATNKEFKVEIENEEILSLKEGNTFISKAEGNTKVVFTSLSDENVSTTCCVRVFSSPNIATDIKVEFEKYTVPVGAYVRISTGVFPKNSVYTKYDVEISDFGILDVVDDDIFIARNPGVATVTFTSKMDDSVNISCTVTVPDPVGLIDEKDGKKYKTVVIGEQEWMAENYAYLNEEDYSNDEKAAWSWKESICYVYEGGDLSFSSAKRSRHYKKYGAFYNYAAAVAYAPKGWHLPTKEDWVELQKFLGVSDEEINRTDKTGRGDAFNRLKEPGSWTKILDHSIYISDSSNNQTGWSAKAAGFGHLVKEGTNKYKMTWDAKNYKAYWWSAEDGFNPEYIVVEYGMYSASSQIYKEELYKYDALSVRYVKDK